MDERKRSSLKLEKRQSLLLKKLNKSGIKSDDSDSESEVSDMSDFYEDSNDDDDKEVKYLWSYLDKMKKEEK